jgi:hypothetical protein
LYRAAVRIERPRALRASVPIDISASWGDTCAVELILIVAALVHAPTESRRVESMAEVTLRTIHVQNAGNASIDTVAFLARKPEDAIGVRITAGRRLDTAHDFLARNLHALPIGRAPRIALAGAASGEYALGDRQAVEIIASRLDANESIRAVLTRVALRTARARKAESAGDAGDLRTTLTAGASVTARTAATTAFTSK